MNLIITAMLGLAIGICAVAIVCGGIWGLDKLLVKKNDKDI